MPASTVSADDQTYKVALKKSKAEAEFIILAIDKDDKIEQAIWVKSSQSTKDFRRLDRYKDDIIDRQEFMVAQIFCC